MSDYYKILGISRDASIDDIKQAYKTLARKHHPDRGGNKEEFQKIQEAYETLSNNDKKYDYDNPNIFPQGNVNGFPDIFGFHFNQSQQQQQHSIKKKDHLYTCKITLKDVWSGIKKKFKIQRTKRCKVCLKTCEACRGNGIITKHVQLGPFTQVHQQSCSKCNGTGKISDSSNNCSHCDSNGNIIEDNIFEIDIPQGVKNGEKFVLKDWGEQPLKDNDFPGDFIVTISIETDTFFTRQNLDLFCNINLSYTEAIVGKEIIIPHFSEKIPINTQGFGIINPNKYYTLYDRGLVDKTGKLGHLHIKFIINYPERTFNQDELKILKESFDKINFQ
jgi:DnaJ-class molecular chaperone